MNLDQKLTNEYINLFDTLEIQPGWIDDVNLSVATVVRNKDRYEKIATKAGCPWFLVAVIHGKECSFNFHGHLHNGDPLSARTIHVPIGRPIEGQPPFTFEFSALDALKYDKVTELSELHLPNCLYFLEKYNGWGYRFGDGIHTTPRCRSPYLWAGSQHWIKGKYVADKVFNPYASSKNLGAAVLLKALEMRGIITFDKVTELQNLHQISAAGLDKVDRNV